MKVENKKLALFKLITSIVLVSFFCFEIFRIFSPPDKVLASSEVVLINEVDIFNSQEVIEESKLLDQQKVEYATTDKLIDLLASSFNSKIDELERKDQEIAFIKSRTLTSPAQYEAKIREKCAIYGCNSAQLIRVMYCESKANPRASNGINMGLFQQDYRFWAGRAAKYGLQGADIFDPYAQIHVATQMFAQGMASHWTCK